MYATNNLHADNLDHFIWDDDGSSRHRNRLLILNSNILTLFNLNDEHVQLTNLYNIYNLHVYIKTNQS